jgi:hypothetical protein
VRIVMWSGPRNLSTALMRSFGARADTEVLDEPFYAAFLAATGIDHPMRDAVIAAGETDWRRVAAACAAEPTERPIRYEKHMTHHMIEAFGLDWTRGAVQAFLIRDPRAVAGSYAAKREAFVLEDLGLRRQAELFDRAADRLGRAPPVVDAADIRRDPECTLRALCAALGIGFDRAMLSWAPGRRATDGVWARHWYGAVERSIGFAPPETEPVVLPEAVERLIEPAAALYARLAGHALRGAPPA